MDETLQKKVTGKTANSMAPKNKKRLVIVSLALILTAMGMTLHYLLTQNKSEAFEYENNSVIGLMPGVNRDALLAQMQDNVDKSAIAFSINSSPVIEGRNMNILFENPEGNEKDLSIELFDNATGKSVYKSKAIREGSYISTISIGESLDPGEHILTAYITAYDIQTHQAIGQAAAELKTEVLD